MIFKLNKFLFDFDESVNRYLLFLVHVQNGQGLDLKEKIEIFNVAIDISNEIYATVQKLLSDLNEFNIDERTGNLEKSFKKISDIISKENKYYKNDVKINDNTLFLYNIIFDKLTDTTEDVHLTVDKIVHLLSYKDLTKNKEVDRKAEKEKKEIEEKKEKELYELKLKTFKDYLKGNQNKNPELFFKVNYYILDRCKNNPIKFVVNDIPNGYNLYFIIKNKELIVKEKRDISDIEYRIRFVDLDELFFLIIIDGFIVVKNKKKTFFINEGYLNKEAGKILNTYNIRKIIEKFNELIIEYHKENNDDDDDKPDDIDDFLDGKI